MRPVIAITGGPAYDRQFHSHAITLSKPYTAAVVAAGGLPIMALDRTNLEEYVNIADGLIASGGQAYSPDPAIISDSENDMRDIWDMRLIRVMMLTAPTLLPRSD